MSYRAIGIMVEGIGALNVPGATLWSYGRAVGFGAAVLDGVTSLVVNDALVAAPQLSATEFDPLSGDLRSGALQVKLHLRSEIAQSFLAQAQARKPQATLAAPLLSSELEATFTGPVTPGLYHLGEEVLQVGAVVSGYTYAILRGVASTQTLSHVAGASLYSQPAWWAGRRVQIVLVELTEGGVVIQASARWTGYMTRAPEAVASTSQLVLVAEDALSTIRRIEVNRTPHQYNTSALWEAYSGSDGRQRLTGRLDPDDFTPRVRKLDGWAADGFWRAVSVADTIIVTQGESAVNGIPVLDSPIPTDPLVKVAGPYHECAVWSQQYFEVCPTRGLPYPMHPLSIAAALLFSTAAASEDVTRYDVLDPAWSCGLAYLLDASAWDALIEETSHVEIDQLVLGYRGERVKVWELITRELLPAYGFALTQTPAGALAPIRVGIADILDYSSAPQIEVLPGVWEWSSGLGGALDELRATIGALPWREGRTVTITGDGVRTQAGSRAMRSVKPTLGEISCPTIAGDAAETYGATTLLSRLLWRYDGLPVVRCQLPEATRGYTCGQWVRLLRPQGLVTPILFDRAGGRVDVWDTEPLIAQITSLRYIADKGYYEAMCLLTNYSFGRVAKWRAPAARILTRFGTAQYLVSGTSDFEQAASDALTLMVGDEVKLTNRVYRSKASGVRTVTAIAPAGANYLITLSADWSPTGAADDWLYIARSESYANNAVVPGYDYPYVVMSTTTITRPTGPADDPDVWS